MTKREQAFLFLILAALSLGGMLMGYSRLASAVGVGVIATYVLAAVALLVLTVLMPYFVYVTAREARRSRELLEKLVWYAKQRHDREG